MLTIVLKHYVNKRSLNLRTTLSDSLMMFCKLDAKLKESGRDFNILASVLTFKCLKTSSNAYKQYKFFKWHMPDLLVGQIKVVLLES